MATTTSTSSSTGALANLNMIDVTALVNKVIAAEKVPQDTLKSSLTEDQSKLAAYQSLNTNVKSLQTSAEAIIGSVYATSPSWASKSAWSSSAKMAATTSDIATSGSYTFNVTSLATPTKMLYPNSLAAAIGTAASGSVTFTVAGVDTIISPTSPNTTFTLSELASAINDSDAGVSASLIKTGTDAYRLQLTSSATGTDNSFTVTGIDGLGTLNPTTDVTAATNATIHYGGSSSSAFDVTSSTNTFTNVFPGVTFTTSAVEDDVTLTIADDVSGMSSQVQALVTAFNSSFSALQSATTYSATDKTAGLLMGESSVRSIATSLPQAFLSAIAPISTDIGLSVDKYGVITFNATTFAAAMASDASGTKAAIIDWAQQIGQITNNATAVATGTISRAISSSESEIESVNTKIADWDQKLKDRTTLLTQLYSTINANLATLKTTSDWISDQITALTTKTN